MTRRLPDEVELRIPSQLRFLALVDAAVQAVAGDFGWPPDDVNNLGTSAIEAASNAMEHGNRFADDKVVVLRIRTGAHGVEIDVEDQGPGFDPRPYERELSADDLLKLRGRGIFIMRSFTDEVTFTYLPQHGMRVRLRKHMQPVSEKGGGRTGIS
jgi:anti-sigma regulatory factor (Ser/Thr protein kinase)